MMLSAVIELDDVNIFFNSEDILVAHKGGEGMEIGKKELNDMLVQYLKENF